MIDANDLINRDELARRLFAIRIVESGNGEAAAHRKKDGAGELEIVIVESL